MALFGLADVKRRQKPFSLNLQDKAPRSLVSTQGTLRITLFSRRFLLKPGTVFYLNGTETVEASGLDAASDWELLELRFTGKRAHEYVSFLIERFGPYIPSTRPRRMTALLRTFTHASNAAPEQVERAVFRWFTTSHRSGEAHRSKLADFLTAPADTLIAVASEHGFSLTALAVHFNCSPSHLAGGLRHTWGMPAAALLQEARWVNALRLMRTNRLLLRDIAPQCGYASASAFSAAFKKRFGESPSRLQSLPASPTLSALDANRPATAKPRLPVSSDEVGIGERTAIIPNAPYYHFDGGETASLFETPFKLMINTVSDALQWVYTLKGSAIFEVGNQQLKLTPGTVLIYPQPINAQWVTPKQGQWRRVWLKLRGSWAMDTLAAFVSEHGWMVSIPTHSRPVALARKWVRFWHPRRSRFSLEGSEAAFEWFLSWRKLLEDGQIHPLPSPDLGQFLGRSFFRRIKSVTAYAREVGYSRSYLSRKLKAQWAETPLPGTFLRQSRLAHAAHELRNTRLSVEEIGKRALYAHTSTFIQAFRKAYHLTPLQYRLRDTKENFD